MGQWQSPWCEATHYQIIQMPLSGDVSERGKSAGILLGHLDDVEHRHHRRGRVFACRLLIAEKSGIS